MATAAPLPHSDDNPGQPGHDLPAQLKPMIRRVLAPAVDLAEAQAATQHLAHAHYENFPVVSMLLPRHLRQDFCNIYSFCRVADDLGDELGDCQLSLQWLARFKDQTRACYAGQTDSAVFIALADTIGRHDIPIQPFLDLIDAFEQDQRVTRYESYEQVLDYCRRSADPVGRLVLYMSGYRDEQRQHLSDKTCTALQFTNFWQDVRRDILERDRIYLPAESMRRFGVTEQQIRDGRCDDRYRDLIFFEVNRTEMLFAEGDALLPLLDWHLRSHVAMFAQGGRAILQAIRRQNFDTLSRRPRLSRWQKGRLIASALMGMIGRLFIPGGRR